MVAPPPRKGYLAYETAAGSYLPVPFQINPETFGYGSKVNWNLTDSPGQYLPVASFKNFDAPKIPVELIFWARYQGWTVLDVRRTVSRIMLAAQPGFQFRPFGLASGDSSVTGPQFASPPRCKLFMGQSFPLFSGVVENAQVSWEVMNSCLNPLSAKVSFTFVVTSQGLASDARIVEYFRRIGA